MKQAVVFFDIDGTLISPRTGKIPESAALAVRRLAECGHIPVINTGRPYGHIQPQVKDLGFRDYVCACGMYIRMNGEVIQDYRPEKALCEKMRDLVLDCKMDSFFEKLDSVYYIHNFFDMFDSECAVMRKAGVNIRSDIMGDDFCFDKFVVWDNEGSDFARFEKEAAPYFMIIPRTTGFTELVPLGYSKGNGIRKYLESLPAGERTVYAFGDSTNDLEMFRAADVSILMGNGDMTLKDGVEYITSDVDEDGILNALKHFGLI